MGSIFTSSASKQMATKIRRFVTSDTSVTSRPTDSYRDSHIIYIDSHCNHM